jgi:NAD(P)-dependent dehydrogenase (short-subunit alcohol dehydrogenase family)
MGEQSNRLKSNWSEGDIPDQSGKNILITGASSGLGAASAKALLAKGAKITAVVRRPEKMKEVFSPDELNKIEIIKLDISSIQEVSATFKANQEIFDIAIFNAGIMATPFDLTTEGIEMQFATNHLGHFALYQLISSQIKERVVSVASLAHQLGNFGDGSVAAIEKKMQGKGKYSPWGYYGSTKLANLLFIKELNNLAKQQNLSHRGYVAHPGYSFTNLGFARAENKAPSRRDKFFKFFGPKVGQTAQMGALPILCAATESELAAGSYLGPSDLFEMKGFPKFVDSNRKSKDPQLAANLWQASINLVQQIGN